MAAVFSRVLAHLEALPGGSTAFTVPAGRVYVVRDIDWYQSQVAAAAVIRASEGIANLFWFAGAMPVTRYSGFQWRGRQVFQAGMVLQLWADASTTIARVSGYEFSA
jgi:hypothetical protein